MNADAFAFYILDASQPNVRISRFCSSMNLHSTISTKPIPFNLQVLRPCSQTDRPVEGERRRTYVATEGETIPGYVAATKKISDSQYLGRGKLCIATYNLTSRENYA